MAELVLTRKIETQGRYFVTGFHGIGWTGYIASRFLIGRLGGERVGYLVFEGMRPVIRLWQRAISYPHDLFSVGGNVFLASEAPFPDELTMAITRDIAAWVQGSGFKVGIVIGGLTNAVRREGDPAVMGVATSKAVPLMEQHKIPWMPDDLNIVGPLAGLLFHAERLGLPLLALLPFAEARPDRKAAAAAIDKLSEILSIRVDTRDLIQAEEVEQQIHQMLTAQMKNDDQESHHYM